MIAPAAVQRKGSVELRMAHYLLRLEEENAKPDAESGAEGGVNGFEMGIAAKKAARLLKSRLCRHLR